MMRIVICEDNQRERIDMEQTVNKYILTKDCDMELALSASGPIEVLDYLDEHPITSGLYFLDIDLRHEMNGIELAAKIRKTDISATIVFITTHEELMFMVFTYKVEAMDYITKDRPAEEVKTRTVECMQLAYQRYLDGKHSKTKYFPVKVGGQILNIPHDEILLFETHPQIRKRMLLYTEKGKIDFRGIISEIEKLVPDFYRCHKSFIVNPSKIVILDKAKSKAELVNGQLVFVAAKKVSELARMIEDR